MYGHGAIFQKKGKKGQNIWKFGQTCIKFENICTKGSLMSATIACMKQQEYALQLVFFSEIENGKERNTYTKNCISGFTRYNWVREYEAEVTTSTCSS